MFCEISTLKENICINEIELVSSFSAKQMCVVFNTGLMFGNKKS